VNINARVRMISSDHIRVPQVLGNEEKCVRRLNELFWKIRIWKDTRGQDLIEYALMAGFVAVAAGAMLPKVSTSITTIFSKVESILKAGNG